MVVVEHGVFNVATAMLPSAPCPDFKSDQAERLKIRSLRHLSTFSSDAGELGKAVIPALVLARHFPGVHT